MTLLVSVYVFSKVAFVPTTSWTKVMIGVASEPIRTVDPYSIDGLFDSVKAAIIYGNPQITAPDRKAPSPLLLNSKYKSWKAFERAVSKFEALRNNGKWMIVPHRKCRDGGSEPDNEKAIYLDEDASIDLVARTLCEMADSSRR